MSEETKAALLSCVRLMGHHAVVPFRWARRSRWARKTALIRICLPCS
jgi:hypothetical protein